MRKIGLLFLLLSIGIAFMNVNVGVFIFGAVLFIFSIVNFQSNKRPISYIYFVFGLVFTIGTIITGF